MNKREFLKKLKESLEISLGNDIVRDKINYYDDYITKEIENGKTEKEVIDELGDPILIAKTIKTVNGATGEVFIKEDINNDNNTYEKQNENNDKENNNYYRQEANYSSNRKNPYIFVSPNGSIGCIIAFLVLFIIIMSILRLAGYIVIGTAGAVFGLGPIGLILVILIIWLLFGRNNRN